MPEFGSVRETGSSTTAPRFAADAMLGKLGRWLRALGYDTTFEASVSDERLVERTLAEERILLTCDRKLAREWTLPRDQLCVLEHAPLREQLLVVARRFQLHPGPRAFTRCMECNVALRPLAAIDAAGRVPSRILDQVRCFCECSQCRRVFWEGSHTAHMWSVLREVAGVRIASESDRTGTLRD